MTYVILLLALGVLAALALVTVRTVAHDASRRPPRSHCVDASLRPPASLLG